MQKKIGSSVIGLLRVDIATIAVDAIVNGANKCLVNGGGVAI